LPDQAARQLPVLSTTFWVEPSSTGDTRRRGALHNSGFNKLNVEANVPDTVCNDLR
jgi:hypothetical protein